MQPPTQPPAPAPARAPALHAISLMAADIKLAHSVFALPFALLAVFLVGVPGGFREWAVQLTLVIVCMVSARTLAMLVNRLADRHFDALHPRTRGRAFASGSLPPRAGWMGVGACVLVFLLACSGFWFLARNLWPLILALPVLGWVALYSFTKRFTALCHLFLGGALAASPLAAALATNPPALAHTPSLLYISLFVLLWVAGFDIIYALQDRTFDISQRLHSIPAALGVHGAIWTSRLLHLAAFAAIVQAWRLEPRFGPIFAGAILLALGLVAYEHILVEGWRRRNTQKLSTSPALHAKFFALNGVASVAVGLGGITEVAMRNSDSASKILVIVQDSQETHLARAFLPI